MTEPMAAWRTTYTPGTWLALSGSRTLVVMPAVPEHLAREVENLWRSLLDADSVDALLALVAEAGLENLPHLGAFFWSDDQLHGLARGDVHVVDADTGETAIDGRGSITWRERELGSQRRLLVELDGRPHDPTPRLPLVVGAASVSSLYLSTADEDVVRFPVAPAVVSEPVEDVDGEEPWQEPAGDESESELWQEPSDTNDFGADAEPSPEVDHEPEPQATADQPPREPEYVSPIPPPSPPVADAVGQPDDADDVGTLLAADIAASHKPSAPEPREPQVLAVPCVNGHANPPGSRTCRLCQGPVEPMAAQPIRRPILAGVHSNFGDFVNIDGAVVIGRSPDANRGPSGAVAMRVPSPSNDISRSHLLVTVRDWNVHVTDLLSTNGTLVLPVGEPPFTLADGASVQVELGTVLDLGDGVSVRIEPPRG